MFYFTIKLPISCHQMTLEELFSGKIRNIPLNEDETATRTYEVKDLSWAKKISASHISYTHALKAFNEKYKDLRLSDRKTLYKEFYLPKKSGGLRRIDAPNDELMKALRELKDLFETVFGRDSRAELYHTSAYAYIKHRGTIYAMKKHQQNKSRWFAHYDLSNFFGNTTPEFLMNMLSKIFPFCIVTETDEGRKELAEALDLCFLNGGLPQGTPISPLLTNIMMIPIDYKLSNALRNFNNQRYVYIRYADDFIISSEYDFKFREIERFLIDTLQKFNAPFTINPQKTRYGSSAGSNWNLGIMLNKDNEMSIGHKKKKQFIAMVSSYIMDKKNGVNWEKNDVQVLDGYRNYYRMIERENIDKLIEHLSKKFNADIMAFIKADLAA